MGFYHGEDYFIRPTGHMIARGYGTCGICVYEGGKNPAYYEGDKIVSGRFIGYEDDENAYAIMHEECGMKYPKNIANQPGKTHWGTQKDVIEFWQANPDRVIELIYKPLNPISGRHGFRLRPKNQAALDIPQRDTVGL